MTLEELADVEVTTVSKKTESRLEAAAAVYVITQEDIRRTGVTTLVEALALAPGVEVARVNANKWAVGIRGFTSTLSRSVLVLIDGRSVYSPLFAGVYWEAQDTLLEDVDRIEVIRGPGGTLWGANAVNGVINIITKRAAQTQGGLVSAAAGTEDRFLGSARYGGEIGDKTFFRAYGKYSDRDSEFHADGNDFDAWHMAQGGFRADSTVSPRDTITVQGDGYSSRNGEQAMPSFYTKPYITTVDDTGLFSGANVLGRWTRAKEDGTELVLQAYYDYAFHKETIFEETRNTVDVDFQDRFRLGVHELTAGLGFRFNSSDTATIETVVISPALRTDELYSGFVQDEIWLVADRLRLTAGAKLEHNGYSGFEFQPTIRLFWDPGRGQYVWAAVSRAVRPPNRLEFDVSRSVALGPATPIFFRLSGDGNFVSEKVIAYEAGYRRRLGAQTVFDLTGFYNDYSDLTSGEPAGPPFAEGSGSTAHIVAPFVFRNGLEGHGTGAELAVDTGISSWLTVRASYSYLAIDLKPGPGSTDQTSGPNAEGSTPKNIVTLAAYTNLPHGFAADAFLRYTSRLPAQGVDSAVDLDLRLGWRPTAAWEVSLVGQGLTRPRRLEFAGGEAGNVEIQRAFYGKATWRF